MSSMVWDASPWDESPRRLFRIRLGQGLGLLYLVGPVSDLVDSSLAPARVGAIAVFLAVFVALFLALLPPLGAVTRRGPRAIVVGLALLGLSALAAIAAGAPQSFVALFVYFVVAAGMLLPTRSALVVVAATAASVALGLDASGAGSSVTAAISLTILTIGGMMTSFGRHVRTIRELRAARENLARLAVAEERLRISRDLHDLLGQSLSVIALKSELTSRLVEQDSAAARRELEDVRRVARQALSEMREAVQGYRRLAFREALDGARQTLSAAGIALRVAGSPEHLPTEVESVLAWALREATTNVVRHSGAYACEVTVDRLDEAVSLQVDDDGTTAVGAAGDGVGLSGLAERARRLDGTLEAGARPGGGYRLRLQLPLGT